MAAGLKQAFFGQGSRGDKAHHLAPDHRLGTALLRLCGILHLFADGDAKTLANEGQEIAFGGMDGHAAHGNILIKMLAAFGERNIQRLGRGRGIIKE